MDEAPEAWIAGVDEAGRGPLAGPVVAAAVILDPRRPIDGVRDSKALTARSRVLLARAIRTQALAWAIGRAAVDEIDRINILQATLLAMRRAVEGLAIVPRRVLVDGNQTPPLAVAVRAVVGGDASVPAISAASVLAKVARDADMVCLDLRFPGYGFRAHKGYATALHMERLRRLGPSPVHRRSFAPVRAALAQSDWFE